MKKNKFYNLSLIFVLLLSCFLIFGGAETNCNIQQGILGGKDPSTLGKQEATDAVRGFASVLAAAASTIALIFIVIGGIQYITAGGNQEQAGKAKNTLTWAVIGFILIIASYGIIVFFTNVLFKK